MIAEISIYLPNVEHMSPHVAKLLSVIDANHMEFSLGPMSTSIRGDADSIFSVLKQSHDVLKSEADDLIMNIAIIDRLHERHSLSESIHCVESLRGAKKASA